MGKFELEKVLLAVERYRVTRLFVVPTVTNDDCAGEGECDEEV